MKRLLCVAALATAYKLTPKELVYAEMRRQVGEFPAANHSNEATIYVAPKRGCSKDSGNYARFLG